MVPGPRENIGFATGWKPVHQRLEAACPQGREGLAGARRAVEVHGYPHPGESSRHSARDGGCLLHPQALHRNKRQNVEGSQPGMHAGVPPHVDAVHGQPGDGQGRPLDNPGRACEGDDRAMVVCIGSAGQHFGTFGSDGPGKLAGRETGLGLR